MIPERYKNMGFTKVGQKKKSTRDGKKWMVLAKKGDQYKVVHGGDSNMKDFSQHGSEKRKKAFWDRMGGKDSAKAKDPFSPLYYHRTRGTWEDGGPVGYDEDLLELLQDGGPVRMDPLVNQIITHFDNQRYNPLAPIPEIELKDPRKVRGTTGKPINPNKDLLSGKYSQEYIDRIIDASKDLGVDPNIALAVALQESKFGKTTPGNIGHILELDEKLGVDGDDDVYDFVTVLKNKMGEYADTLKIPKDDKALRIQAYNGYGKLKPETEQDYHGYKAKSFYGVEIPKEGLDMRKNPLYGKQILDLSENIIKKNEYIQNRINDNYQLGGLINTTGYTKGTPTESNPFNIIPSGDITMENTVYDSILAIPNNDKPIIMKKGKNYKFKNSDSVLEIPMKQMGGEANYDPREGDKIMSGIIQESIKKIMGHIDSKKLSNKDREKFFEITQEAMFDPYAPVDKVSKQVKQEFKGKLDTDFIDNVLYDNHVRTRMVYDDYVGLDSTITEDEDGGLRFNRKYQQGGGIDFNNLLGQFNNIGVNTQGVNVDDPKQSIQNLMLALASSQMFMKGDNNIDLSSPLYMQTGGGVPGPYAPGMRPMSLIPEKNGFGNKLLQTLGLQMPNSARRQFNTDFQSHNTNLQQQTQLLADQTNLTTNQANTNNFSDLLGMIGMFNAISNFKDGGEVMVGDMQQDGKKIPIQAEKRGKGGNEMIRKRDENGLGIISSVNANDSHKYNKEKGKEDKVTEFLEPGDYVFSADPSTKMDLKDIIVYITEGTPYEEKIGKEGKKKEPEQISMADALGLEEGKTKVTPAEAVKLVKEKYPYDQDIEEKGKPKDPYYTGALTMNKNLRSKLIDTIEFEAEKAKGFPSVNIDDLVMAQMGYQVPVPQINNPYTPQLSGVPYIRPYGTLAPPQINNPYTTQLSTLPSIIPEFSQWGVNNSTQPFMYSPMQQQQGVPQDGGSSAASGFNPGAIIGNILSWSRNNKTLKELPKQNERVKADFANLFNDRKDATTQGSLSAILGNLALDTNVDRLNVDDSAYRNINPEARQNLRRQDRLKDAGSLFSAISANPRLSAQEKSQMRADVTLKMFRASDTTGYLADLDRREMGLQESRNLRNRDEQSGSNTERSLRNQQLSAISQIASRQPLAINDIDFAALQNRTGLDANLAAQIYQLNQKRNQDVAGTISSATPSGSDLLKILGLG